MHIQWFKTFTGLFHSNSVISISYETYWHFSSIEKDWDLYLKQNVFLANIYRSFVSYVWILLLFRSLFFRSLCCLKDHSPIFVDALIAIILTCQWQWAKLKTMMVIYKRSIIKNSVSNKCRSKIYSLQVDYKVVF